MVWYSSKSTVNITVNTFSVTVYYPTSVQDVSTTCGPCSRMARCHTLPLGELKRSPDPLAAIRGPTSKGEGKGEEGRAKEGEGEGELAPRCWGDIDAPGLQIEYNAIMQSSCLSGGPKKCTMTAFLIQGIKIYFFKHYTYLYIFSAY